MSVDGHESEQHPGEAYNPKVLFLSLTALLTIKWKDLIPVALFPCVLVISSGFVASNIHCVSLFVFLPNDRPTACTGWPSCFTLGSSMSFFSSFYISFCSRGVVSAPTDPESLAC